MYERYMSHNLVRTSPFYTSPFCRIPDLGGDNFTPPEFRGRPQETAVKHGLSGPISRDIAILSLPYRISRDTLKGMLARPSKWCDTPPGYLVLHRHICAIPHFATYRAIIVRYPIKTSTKEFCDTIATSIARYEKYRCWASKNTGLRTLHPQNLGGELAPPKFWGCGFTGRDCKTPSELRTGDANSIRVTRMKSRYRWNCGRFNRRKPKGDGGKKKNVTTICDKRHDNLRHFTTTCDIL